MPVNPNNVVQGPAVLYWNAFGSAEPPDTNAAVTQPPWVTGNANWTDLGATTGGVSLSVAHTYTQIKADQNIDPIGARLSGRTIQVMANLLEATMQNLWLAMNQVAIQNPLSGVTTLDPITTTSATQPTYIGLIIDGWAPTLATGLQARRRIIVRKVLDDLKASAKYDLTNQVTWDCTFTAYYVSSTIAPFHIQDQTA
ncbi:MAG: hypothetical protein ABSG46_20265 [Candidatus Binataceae bacterium]|jgi:hypothetical protein